MNKDVARILISEEEINHNTEYTNKVLDISNTFIVYNE